MACAACKRRGELIRRHIVMLKDKAKQISLKRAKEAANAKPS